MKTIVIFDSNFGNTKQIADAIAEVFRTLPKRVNEVSEKDLEEADLIIAGSPINGWRPSDNMKEFLQKLKPEQLKKSKAAAFDTRVKIFISGNAAKRISKALEEAGAKIISSPKGFHVTGYEGPLVDGEIERAKKWAKNLEAKMEMESATISLEEEEIV